MTKRPDVINLALAGKLHLLEDPARYPSFGEGSPCNQVDPELFFSDKLPDIVKAKAVCNSCPLVAACLEWALRNEEYGVFGGKTPEERSALKAKGELVPTLAIQAMEIQKTLILSGNVKTASAEFGVNERTILRWRQVLEPQRKAG